MISTVEKVLFLKSIDLFRLIPGEDLAQVASITEQCEFDAGESLITEGDLGDSLYLIIEGRVDVVKGGATIARLGPKECAGEMSILDSEPRSATVRASAPTVALRLGREEFDGLLEERIDIARGIIKVLCQRLRATTARRNS